ncbi:MAG TPA: hypothetical protein VMC02_03000 [Steroidobacteraceae bacterium]|nr:hypothetical protein [Steroidobacteraceae bacterium]
MSIRFLIAACGLLLAAGSGPVLAQAPSSAPPPNPFAGMVRFGGTVASAAANTFVVHSEDGGDVSLSLPEKLNIMVSGKGTVADLAAGKFVGCTAVKRADGLLHATECHIFPESMRGMGEGHNPMGPPDTTMTNGNVATLTNGQVAATSAGATVTLRVAYKGGEQAIAVGPDATVTRIGAGTPDMIKPGVKVTGAARAAPDGSAQVVFLSLTP